MSELVSVETIRSSIRELPGRPPFMLAKDLAALYETSPKRLGEAVKRNPERFPADFVFRLTRAEWEFLRSDRIETQRSQSATSQQNHELSYEPLAFTREGANMLSAVLHTPEAVARSVQIMRAFSKMEAEGLTGVVDRIDAVERRLAAMEVRQEDTGAVRMIARAKSRIRRGSPRFSFWYDTDLRAFLDEAYGTGTIDAIAAMAQARFGSKRAPSRSAIGRYFQWLDRSRGAA